MIIWLIYRIFKNKETGSIYKIEPIEYVNNEADAKKYLRLFDLQTPHDLRDIISHRHHYTTLIER